MTEYVIEKDVPMPDGRRGSKIGPLTTALIAMEVGDSVFMGRKPTEVSGLLGPARKRCPDWVYAMRSVEGGCRIWRVK